MAHSPWQGPKGVNPPRSTQGCRAAIRVPNTPRMGPWGPVGVTEPKQPPCCPPQSECVLGIPGDGDSRTDTHWDPERHPARPEAAVAKRQSQVGMHPYGCLVGMCPHGCHPLMAHRDVVAAQAWHTQPTPLHIPQHGRAFTPTLSPSPPRS